MLIQSWFSGRNPFLMELHGHESQNHKHHLSMIFVEFLYCKISMLSNITENNYVIFIGDKKQKKKCVFSTKKKTHPICAGHHGFCWWWTFVRSWNFSVGGGWTTVEINISVKKHIDFINQPIVYIFVLNCQMIGHPQLFHGLTLHFSIEKKWCIIIATLKKEYIGCLKFLWFSIIFA